MKKFAPTFDQIRLAEALMTAMAFEATIRPTVETYRQSILQKHQFRIARKWVEMGVKDSVILDYKQAYLLSSEDANVFYAECFAARDAAGLKVEHPEHCPLLVAEHLRVQAENALLEAISTIPGLENLGSAILTLDERKRAIDLTLKLLAPFCGNANEILQRYTAA